MDLPTTTSMQVEPSGFDQRRSTSRSDSQESTESISSHTSVAMTIPGTRREEAPPPLPPPRFNEDLTRGIDLAWSWGNSQETGGSRTLAPIKPGSSLYRDYMDSRAGTNEAVEDELEGMDIDEEFDRRGSTVSTIRSPSQAETDTGRHIHIGIRRPSSPAASTANQRLQGERPLAQENLSRSSHAYDKHVLSKIGKPNSPPRHFYSDSGDATALATKLSLETNSSGSTRRSVTDIPYSATDSLSRWVTSPISAGVSPVSRQGWRDYNIDYRSPSIDSTAPASAVDPDIFTRLREGSRPSTSGSLPGIDNSISLASRSKRGSYDQSSFLGYDSDFPGEDAGVFRRLHLSDVNPLDPGKRPSFVKGIKRRALSPPTTVARDDSLAAHAFDLSQRPSVVTGGRSPTIRFQPKHGSVSSTCSSVRQNSYASSVGPSIAGSSMTSASSIERFSPSVFSPSDGQASPYTTSTSTNSPATSITPFRKPPQNAQESKATTRNSSIQTGMSEGRPSPTGRIGGHFICECCPKKPKKFDTADELRAHEMEKQYSCQYCHNRFKNKNEAERHQNSLHLRRHSWACSVISGWQAAFHPSSSNSSQGPIGPTSDACGFCGEEFPNNPQPDWDRRIDHLTNVHKFNECNQAKKFYRADHFRQHLKHSHAGSSGKWTNMLENACMRDELPGDATGNSPTGSEVGRGPSSLPAPADAPMGGATIREMDES